MGQGHYNGFIYGTILEGELLQKFWDLQDSDSEIYNSKFENFRENSKFIRDSYESEQKWIGRFITCSDGALSEWWNAHNLDYSAIPFSQLKYFIERFSEYEKARLSYDIFRKGCIEYGLNLPEGEIIAVWDYD